MDLKMTNSTGARKAKLLVLTIIGILMIIGSLIWMVRNYQFVSRAVSAKGTVISLNAGGSHPQIRFTAGDGKPVEYSQSGLIFGYRPGDEVEVLYDPEAPQKASVNTFGAMWGFPFLGFLIGACFAAVSLWYSTE